MLIINFIKQIYNLLQNQSELIDCGLFSKKKLNFSLKMEINNDKINDKYYVNVNGIICKSTELNSVIKYKFNFIERFYIRYNLKKIAKLLSEIDKNNLTTHVRNIQQIIK
jgi:hypothetical protein